MAKKIKFPQKETEIAETKLDFEKNLVDEEHDGVFMVVTKKDGSRTTSRHMRRCTWD